MSNILFIYPDVREQEEEYSSAIASSEYEGMYYEGIASISAVLKINGHKTKLFHITEPLINEDNPNKKMHLMDKNANLLFDVVEKFKPNIIAFSSTTNQFHIVKELAYYLRDTFKCDKRITTICGGIHTILSPEEVINTYGIDIVCLGEGENVLLELANNIPISQIKGIWHKGCISGTIFKSEKRELIKDLDTLPFPDTDIFDYEKSYDYKLKRLNLVVSRGCPYSCSYCCNHAIRESYKNCGNYFRMHSPEYVVSQIKNSLQKYPGIEYCDFRDDNFLQNEKWVDTFLELYKKEINLPLVIIARADKITDEIMEKLSEIPCRMIRLGIESGNAEIIKSLNRTVNKERILNAVRLAKKYNITIYPFYILNLPQEDAWKFMDTIKLHARLVEIGSVKLDMYHLSVFYPYAGTKLYKYCKEHNLIVEKDISNYFIESIFENPLFPNDEIEWLRKNFQRATKLFIMGSDKHLVHAVMLDDLGKL